MWAKKREGGGGGWTGNIFMKKKKDPADLPMPSSFHRLRAAVPLLVEDCISWLEQNNSYEEEGLFRVSGEHDVILAIHKKYLKGRKVNLNKMAMGRPHVVAGVLKKYLRELDVPLLTNELYDSFIDSITGTEDEKEQVKRMKSVIALLPIGNELLLTRLMNFLALVAKHADTNKMTLKNIATIFAPTLCRNGTNPGSPRDGTYGSSLIEYIILHTTELFVEVDDTTKETEEGDDFYGSLHRRSLRLNKSIQEELESIANEGTPDSPEAEDSLVRPRAVSAANQQGLITWADIDFYRPAATEAPPAAMSPPSPARKLSISEPPPTTAPQMPPTKPKVIVIPKLSREKMSQLEPSDSESTSPPPHSTSPKRILSISGGARLQQKRVTTTSPSPEDTTFPRKRSISASSNAAPTTPIQLSPRKRDGVSSLEGIAGYNCTLTLKKEDIDKQNPKKPKSNQLLQKLHEMEKKYESTKDRLKGSKVQMASLEEKLREKEKEAEAQLLPEVKKRPDTMELLTMLNEKEERLQAALKKAEEERSKRLKLKKEKRELEEANKKEVDRLTNELEKSNAQIEKLQSRIADMVFQHKMDALHKLMDGSPRSSTDKVSPRGGTSVSEILPSTTSSSPSSSSSNSPRSVMSASTSSGIVLAAPNLTHTTTKRRRRKHNNSTLPIKFKAAIPFGDISPADPSSSTHTTRPKTPPPIRRKTEQWTQHTKGLASAPALPATPLKKRNKKGSPGSSSSDEDFAAEEN